MADRDSRSSTHPSSEREFDAPAPNRKRAILLTLPFLLLGLGIVAFGVVASPRPLFGFLVFPPVAAVCVLTYLAFRERFGADGPPK